MTVFMFSLISSFIDHGILICEQSANADLELAFLLSLGSNFLNFWS